VENLSDFLQDVGYSTSFLDKPLKNRGEVELWTIMTRALLNPLSLESKMFQDNIAPLKEDKLLWEEYQREEQKFLKSNRNDDEGSSARNATPHKLKEKGGLSPSGNKR
jgi:hypothetical protein